jgi:hypothetical protein
MSILLLIAAMTALLVISYFIIKDGNQQLDNYDLGDLDDDDPTITCWDDDKAHTEDKF